MTRRSFGGFGLTIALSAWLAVALPASAQSVAGAQTGTYQAGPAQYTTTITAWGADCGPRPKTYVDPARPRVTVANIGAQLALQFPDRRVRSDQCWSPNKAVALTSTASTAARWQSECRTAANEPKKESGRYVIAIKGPYTLELSEESTYDWQLKTSRCQAVLQMTQTLERVAEERAGQPAKLCTIQTPIRIRLRPGEAELQPGQRSCFSVIETDAAGCSQAHAANDVVWELTEPAGARATLQEGCFRAAQSAAEAEGMFRIVAKVGAMQAQAQVRVAASDLSDITARRGALANAPGDKPEAPASDDLTTAKVGSVSLARDKQPLVWMSLAAAAAVLGAGLWFGTRRKKAKRTKRTPARTGASDLLPKASPPRGEATHTPDELPPTPAAPLAGSPSPEGGQLICPSCRRGFAPGASTCTADGTALVTYSEFVSRHQAQAGGLADKKCDRCGTLITAGAAFCGDCGARVGP